MRLWFLIYATLISLSAAASESARVVFVSGDAWVGEVRATVGLAVNEGDVVRTGAGGHVYLKTIDGGFFILRPESVGRVDVYRVDVEAPANTRIRLHVAAGVARHISGTAASSARQTFRLNTPVAAIGVRGTDFSVFTTNDVSRVVVHSGGVVVSPFTGACEALAFGPCEGASSRELFGAQAGLVLQVSRDQDVPQLLQDINLSPDALVPPRPDEANEVGQGGAPVVGELKELDLSPVKTGSIDKSASASGGQSLLWGRWEVVLGQEPDISIAEALETHQLIATGRGFAVLRSAEEVWQKPPHNAISFALKGGSAMIQNERTGAGTLALLQDGALSVNFTNSTFSTSIKLVAGDEAFSLHTLGVVTAEGRLYSSIPQMSPSNMSARGALGSDNLDAAYLFQSRLDAARVASGVTYWAR